MRLCAGKSSGYYLNRLTEELIAFLTPWNNDQKETTNFSSKIYLSSIISFIDAREYVDFVTDIEMNQYAEDDQGNKTFTIAANGTRALFETELPAPHAILASAPEHLIKII
ncbi:MAG: hypothetical protein EOO02_20005 [Chitinophagaceae bacterium]|nr:MAG: hypothetical protein EOO02_20005 [Chitinophagaceae bacterium]